jgi:hypothetical protein
VSGGLNVEQQNTRLFVLGMTIPPDGVGDATRGLAARKGFELSIRCRRASRNAARGGVGLNMKTRIFDRLNHRYALR